MTPVKAARPPVESKLEVRRDGLPGVVDQPGGAQARHDDEEAREEDQERPVDAREGSRGVAASHDQDGGGAGEAGVAEVRAGEERGEHAANDDETARTAARGAARGASSGGAVMVAGRWRA